MSFDPESYRKYEKLVMDRKRRLAGPIDRIIQTLSAVINPGSPTTIAPGALPPLAGDVTGAPGANTVVKVQNIPVSTTDPTTGQVLKYDGAQWAPGTDTAGALTVQELDGAPLDSAVTIIRVTNGKLTDNGAGDVTLDLSGSAVALTIAEIDGTPSGTPTTFQFPNGTVTDQGGGVFRYTPAVSTPTTRWEPLTNGDWGSPELIFFEGDVVMIERPI